MIFTSEIVRCNVPNKNGHVYTKECIEKALEDPIIKEQIENGCFFGGFMKDYNNINGEIDIMNISHKLNKFWWVDDILFGEFETLPTNKGKLLAEEMTKAEQINVFTSGMATAGVGNLEINESGEQIVNNYKLISIDFTKENI